MKNHEMWEFALGLAWSKESAYGNGDRWTPRCPSIDQCAITAMLIQDYLGGDLLRCVCSDGGSHYWNRLPNGTQVDFTEAQFEHLGVQPDKQNFIVREREYLDSNEDTVRRYRILKKRFERITEAEDWLPHRNQRS